LLLTIEEANEQVRNLIAMGRERGYLLSDEINDVLPADALSSEDIETLNLTIERSGIDVYEDVLAADAARAALEIADPIEMPSKEEVGAGADMGIVPLLKKHQEVAIAKRIERGRLLVLKTITRSPIVIKELMVVAGDLRTGTRSIKEIVQFDEDELRDQMIEGKTGRTLKLLNNIGALYDVAVKQAGKLAKIPRSNKRLHLHARYEVSRTRIKMSQWRVRLNLTFTSRNG
jgi:RNA polymerase primary sigma factor